MSDLNFWEWPACLTGFGLGVVAAWTGCSTGCPARCAAAAGDSP